MPRNIFYFIHNTRGKRLFMKRCLIDIVPSKRTKGSRILNQISKQKFCTQNRTY
uniref:Uncharacterized protein n=1 Tax=Meloidogyne incognita TaxID=6306 RepID=A0A914LGS1_MELIC